MPRGCMRRPFLCTLVLAAIVASALAHRMG